MPLVHIDGRLTADRYVAQVVEPVVLPLLEAAPNMDLNPIEQHCDLIRRDMSRRPLVKTADDLLTTVDLVWQQLPQPSINYFTECLAE
ncbi:hypothetical protein TNCV_2581801 [Trichonephila clavipes]|nr:hypothetical protein TNCV_2581801 [Trichonephila clavipes]